MRANLFELSRKISLPLQVILQKGMDKVIFQIPTAAAKK